MSRSINRVQLLGNVGNTPEVKSVGNGTVASFSVATSRQWTDAKGDKQEKTEWHKCIAWTNPKGPKLADIVQQYVSKGSRILLDGEITYRQWQDKDGQTRHMTEIVVRDLTLLDAKPKGAAPAPAPSVADYDDDGMPF